MYLSASFADRFRGAAASATISRSARRTTARATCSAAAACEPPGKMKEVSGGKLGIQRVDFALEPIDLRLAHAQPLRFAVLLRHAEIGAEIEQIVLDGNQIFGEADARRHIGEKGARETDALLASSTVP